MLRHCVAVALVLLSAGVALAQPQAASRIDPSVWGAIRSGRPPPWLSKRLSARPGTAPVLIELDRPADGRAVAGLEALGVDVVRIGNRPVHWRRYVAARVDATALRAIESSSVRSVRLAPSRGIPPLDRSAELMRLASARGAVRDIDGLTGRGTVIADLDTSIDVTHPMFFRADEGWVDWLDVDGDGVFRPGVDAIDRDFDGEAGPGETASLLEATAWDIPTFEDVPVTGRSFDPAVDWIYVDENGDGRRNAGADEGFADRTPAFGEPLFVPDDVDGDGQLDREERLVQLGSSKIRKLLVMIDPDLGGFEHVYERGVDLSSVPRDFSGGALGYADGLHASGVLGIAAGGIALPSRRWVGVAPDAELVVTFPMTRDSSAPLLWLLSERPDVMLHEQVLWWGDAMDGSDAWSALIDESTRDENVAHICPVGNIGGSGKHGQVSVAAGATASLEVSFPDWVGYAAVSLHARGGEIRRVRLRTPDGTTHDVAMDGGGAIGTDALYESSSGLTSRGTHMVHLGITAAAALLPGGTWTLLVRGDPAGPIELHGFVADDVSTFGPGVAWGADVVTDASTLAQPSLADECIAVGSVPSHLGSEAPWYEPGGTELEGEVRVYSARGPRIDGVEALDVVAPDNPWAPLPAGELFPSEPGIFDAPPGAFWVFGGTSGAAPHVAGVAALLSEAGRDAAEIQRAIRAGASASGIDPLPSPDYGYGRLDAAGAFGIARDGEPPVLVLRVERDATSARVTPEVTDPGEPAAPLVRWDDGYDGSWDTAYELPATRTFPLGPDETLRLKVRARDSTGLVDEAALLSERPVAPRADGGLPDGGTPDGATAPPRGEIVSWGCGSCAATPHRHSHTAVLVLLYVVALVARRARRVRR